MYTLFTQFTLYTMFTEYTAYTKFSAFIFCILATIIDINNNSFLDMYGHTFHVKYNTLDLFTTFHKSLMRVLYFTWKSAFLEPIDENFQLTSPYQDEI